MPLQTGSQLLMYQSFIKLADRSEGHAACMACWRGMHNSFCTAVDSCDHHLDMHLKQVERRIQGTSFLYVKENMQASLSVENRP